MKHLGNRIQTASSRPSSSTRYIIIGCLTTLLLLFVGCSSQPFGPQGSDETEASIAATIEVAVEQTVTARLGSPSAVGEVAGATAEQSEQENGDASAADASSAGDSSGSVNSGSDASAGGATVPELSAEEAELAQWVTANTRHYIGDPNAPVVLIEFSDFQ